VTHSKVGFRNLFFEIPVRAETFLGVRDHEPNEKNSLAKISVVLIARALHVLRTGIIALGMKLSARLISSAGRSGSDGAIATKVANRLLNMGVGDNIMETWISLSFVNTIKSHISRKSLPFSDVQQFKYLKRER
jgi:hypothetical protein